MIRRQVLITLVAVAAAEGAAAGEWTAAGFVGLDGRLFWQTARFDGQEDDDFSLTVQPEAYWESEDGRRRFAFVGFGRADSNDGERTHADVRELHWSFEGDGYDVNLGINKVFWGVAESRHLVDVVNQTDLVEDLDQEQKLGQPMINLNLQRDYGRFELFVLPGFRERTFPGVDGRLRGPLPVDVDDALYESSAEAGHLDAALRYSHYFGDLDVGAYVFQGTSREPAFRLAPGGNRVLPYYEQMTQFGVEAQYTVDAWLWKFEGIARDADSDTFFAAVGGFEYTFYGVGSSAMDVGALVEYLYDGRNDAAPPTAFDNDLFFGARLAWNDAADTSLLAGAVIDVDTGEVFFNVEAERRFGDALVAELRLRTFAHADPGMATYGVERDDYLELRLSWYYGR